MQRIFLFLITNIAIMVILSITLRILGVESLLMQNGSDLNINAMVDPIRDASSLDSHTKKRTGQNTDPSTQEVI